MVSRQEQKEKRQQEILEAALDLFISKGYAETKVTDIAEQVGMSTGLMFHYFESKAKLFEELVVIGASGPATMLQVDSSDPLRFFETVAKVILDMLAENSFGAKMFVFMEQACLAVNLPKPIQALLQNSNILKQTTAIVEAGQEQGQLRPGDPLALSVLFWQSLSGVALFKAMNPDAPLPKPEWIIDSIRRKA